MITMYYDACPGSSTFMREDGRAYVPFAPKLGVMCEPSTNCGIVQVLLTRGLMGAHYHL